MTIRMMAAALVAGVIGVASVETAEAQQTRYYDFGSQRWVEGQQNQPQRVYRMQRGQAGAAAMPRPDARFDRRVVTVSTRERPGTIVVDTRNKFLYHVQGDGTAVRYGVGVGKEGFGWSGTATVNRKAEWPGWTPPAEMRRREAAKGRILPAYMAGGPENPLGARALYLYQGGRDTLYRIHGTNQPWTIGQEMSSGCIRMMNEDVEHLYSRVNRGTKVVVLGAGQDVNRVLVETGTVRSAGAERPTLLGALFGSRVQ